MKNIFTAIILLCCATTWLRGQQEEHYTQFMYYKLGFNPAAAGSDVAPNVTALVRNQWVGIDGAPQTQLISLNTGLVNNRVGLGVSVLRQTIGVTENYTADAAYAYRVPLGRGILSMGLQGSVRLMRINFSQLQGTQPIGTDGAIPGDLQSRYVPNFGAGIFLHRGNDVCFGIAVPRILQSNIDLADSPDLISREARHFFAMGGVTLKAGDNVDIQPQLLLKYVTGAPFDTHVNVNMIFNEKFMTGVSYRIGGAKNSGLGESLSLLLGIELSEQITFGLSYDATLTELRKYNSGSFEGVLRYFFAGKPGSTQGGADTPSPKRDSKFY